MTEENKHLSEENKTAMENEFDPAKFKEEMIAEQRQSSETMMNDLVAKMTGVMDEKLAANKPAERITKRQETELGSELETLGIDETQAAAIVSLVKKNSGTVDEADIEKNVMERVSKSVEIKDKKKDLEGQMASKYPDIMNPNSTLWRESQRIYNSFDDHAKNSYMATSLAVESAANKLGIAPIDLNSIRAGQAQNATHGPGNGAPPKKKITQKTLDFGASFGLDPKLYEKHLKDKM